MHFQWFKTEHQRLHIVEAWPDSPQKQAALAAIRSALASLARSLPPSMRGMECEVCLNRQERSHMVTLPPPEPIAENPVSDLAA